MDTLKWEKLCVGLDGLWMMVTAHFHSLVETSVQARLCQKLNRSFTLLFIGDFL